MSIKKKSTNFTEAFEELEKITAWFDSEESSDLDEGLKKFERGLLIADQLKKKLEEVQNTVQEIKLKFQEV